MTTHPTELKPENMYCFVTAAFRLPVREKTNSFLYQGAYRSVWRAPIPMPSSSPGAPVSHKLHKYYWRMFEGIALADVGFVSFACA